MAAKSKPSTKEEPGPVAVTPIPDPKFEMTHPRYYSNYVSIHSTPFDFTLRFCDAVPVYDKPKSLKGGILEVKIPIKAEIVIPKDLLPDLIKTMQEHYERYVKIYAETIKDEKTE